MIQMISGFTSFGGRIISPKDGKISLDKNVEARLVALGMAEYAAEAVQAAPASDFGAGQGANPAPAENGAEAATEGVETLDEPMESMTMAELKALAEGMGIPVKGLRSKAAVISAIEAADKPPDPKVME